MKFRNLIEVDLGEVALADMTDGGAAVATHSFGAVLPAGLLPIVGKIECKQTFTGATTLTGQLGVAADPNCFIDVGSVKTLGDLNVLAGADPDLNLTADRTPLLTLTEDSEWGDVTAGKVSVKLYCIDMYDQVVKAA